MSDADPRLRAVFAPRGVAVVGVSRDPRNLGRQVYENLKRGGYQGALHAVSRSLTELDGKPVFASVRDAPDPVDLAVVAVPAAAVASVVADCRARGVRSLVIISAGFRETGPEGAQREAELRDTLRANGMRAIGPNCMGVLNTHPDVRMNATFSSADVPHGRIAFVSQSGALGLALLARAETLDLGLSYFASLGNKTDVSTNDLLVLWEDDPDVEVILLYLENFGNPRRFLELARRIAAKKPIVAVKSGRTAAGARAAGSHTGALAEPDQAAEALFEQCNIVRARTVQELFDYATVFARARPPAGARVAIVTNSGGPGIMATDALREHGLDLATLSDETKAALRKVLSHDASVQNPVDVIAGASPEAIGQALRIVEADPGVDSVLMIYTPPILEDEPRVVQAIADAHAEKGTLVACVLGREAGSVAFHELARRGIAAYGDPEAAVRALAALTRRELRARRPPGVVPRLDADREAARRVVLRAVEQRREWLEPAEVETLLRAYGFRSPRSALAATPQEAEAAARSIGGPVALKAVSAGLLHKSDVGGVRLDVQPDDAARASAEMLTRVVAKGYQPKGVLVQEMARGVAEVILGISADPKFGPLLMFGAGGIFVEVLKDVSFRLAPLTDEDARRMVRGIRAFPLLEGVRGRPPADVAAVEDALLRLSALATHLPEVREMDVNPLVVGERGQGAVAVDARVRLWPGGEVPRAPAVPADIARSGGSLTG